MDSKKVAEHEASQLIEKKQAYESACEVRYQGN